MSQQRPIKCNVVRRYTAVGAALVLSAVLGVGRASAQVIDSVPAESLAVVKVRNLKATSDKIAKLATDLGVAAMAPPLADPLKALQDKSHISQGLNTAGDLYFIFLDPNTSGETPDKSMAILVPVTDYKAFLGNFADAQTDGDVSQVKMPDDPEPSFVANWGSYAVIAPSKAIAGKKPTAGLKVSPAIAKELDSKEITIFANVPALRAIAQPAIANNKDEILAKVEDELKKNPQAAKFVPVAKAAVTQALNAANAMLRDGEGASYGISLADEGIKTTLVAEFAPGSYIGGTVAGMKNSSGPLLGGLPAGKWLLYEGGVNEPEASAKFFADVADPVVKELVATGPEFAPAADYVAGLKDTMAATKGFSAGVMAPTGALGQEALLQMDITYSGDAAAISGGFKKTMNAYSQLLPAFGMDNQVKLTITPNAKTVDGVSFDSVATTMTADPNNPGAAQQQQMMTMFYGPGGLVQNIGVVDPGHVLIYSGLPDAAVSPAIAAAKSGEAPLSSLEQVKKVAANLPSNRLLEVYVPLDDVVSTALTYAKQFGFNVPVQLPPDLPPLGGTVSSEGSTVRMDGFIPTPLVQSLVAAGMQAAMQMQGGGAPPAGGGM